MLLAHFDIELNADLRVKKEKQVLAIAGQRGEEIVFASHRRKFSQI
jgi:hypothetical protein